MDDKPGGINQSGAKDMPASRARILGAAPNFRNVSNLPAAEGRRIRSGLIYRSGAMDELDDADVAALRALSIRLCFDLRSRSERETAPSRWPEDASPRILAMEVATDIRVLDKELARWLADHPDRDGATRLMHGIYRSMPVSCAPVLSRLFAELAEPDEAQPFLIHCTAGKDRTGFVVAMLLKALGVADALIFDDYLETNRHYDRLRQDARISALLQTVLGFALSHDALQVVTCADRDYLAGAFKEVERAFGSVEQYLQSCAGLDAERRSRLQQLFLAPRP
jgi:protein-tyrosine phosphatase